MVIGLEYQEGYAGIIIAMRAYFSCVAILSLSSHFPFYFVIAFAASVGKSASFADSATYGYG